MLTELFSHLAIVLYHYAVLLLCVGELTVADAPQHQRTAAHILRLVRDHPATWHIYRARVNLQLAALPAVRSTDAESAPAILVQASELDVVAKAILQGG